MRSPRPKPLLPLLGKPMVEWVLAALRPLEPDPLLVVTSPRVAAAAAGWDVVIQEKPRGTADAVAAAHDRLRGFRGDLLVLAADTPLLTSQTLRSLVARHRTDDPAVTVLSFATNEPLPYGRIVRGAGGEVVAIVEQGDATAEERLIQELNSSTYVFAPAALWQGLERLESHNAKGEQRLTAVVRAITAASGRAATFSAPDPNEARGVNTVADLAFAESVLRERYPA